MAGVGGATIAYLIELALGPSGPGCHGRWARAAVPGPGTPGTPAWQLGWGLGTGGAPGGGTRGTVTVPAHQKTAVQKAST